MRGAPPGRPVRQAAGLAVGCRHGPENVYPVGMDSLISAAARALAAGDTLTALKHVALRDDPPALALRGIAMARLGDYARARDLLRLASRRFGSREQLARARCLVAEAEVSLAMREIGRMPAVLSAALAVLEAHADHANAMQARLVIARKQVLLGRLREADATLAQTSAQPLPPALAAVAALIRAELALRSLRTDAARDALAHARQAAAAAGIPSLIAETEETATLLDKPAAKRLGAGHGQTLTLAEIDILLASGCLVVDGCRHSIGNASGWRSLARRPVLFALLNMLAQAWPGDVRREALIATVFRTRRPDESHRARLRVEMGRLRALLRHVAAIEATPDGFALKPETGRELVVLAPPIAGDQASLLALLSDGAAWSTSALALALDTSQRTIQRALQALETSGQVRAIGQTRSRRWLAPPLAGFTTILLLPALLPLK